MKKLIATLALCSLPLMGMAGEYCPRDGKAYDEAVNKLQLSADQKTKLNALHDKHKADMEKQRETMKSMHDKHRDEVKALLGEEKFKQFEQEMKSSHKGHQGKHGMHDHMSKE